MMYLITKGSAVIAGRAMVRVVGSKSDRLRPIVSRNNLICIIKLTKTLVGELLCWAGFPTSLRGTSPQPLSETERGKNILSFEG
ncbi:hypothetical protein Cylst_4159 [Cylindrospermum stagnale PCC 7417]|uniref:Uncharacterized protein n=1 Tax=Cylindrospermum stagnale PCC 7417 TaxID=56107 RepID=K9X1A8_9NOST|nr:hypothetical protein Cylst_4159 [Cylindrospermum stagnale PCC 7417]